jgi:hypothetical protein
MTNTASDVHAGDGRAHLSVRGVGLALLAALVLSLTLSSQAKASNCTDLEECDTAAMWEKAVADDYSNKAAWFRELSRQYFASAVEWGNKADWAFRSGDAVATPWYKAIADDYSRRAVANANAADSYALQALHWAAAADTSFRRYMFIADSPEPGDIPTAGTGGSSGRDGVKSLSRAKTICRKNWRAGLVCEFVKSIGIDGAVRYVWRMVNGRTCLRQRAEPGYINPSTGYVERIEHVCTKWQ